MKKRTSNVSRRIVSLLMSIVLTLTLVTPAAFATEVVDSRTTIVEGDTNPADANPNEDAEGGDTEDKDNEDSGDEQQPADPGDEGKNPDEGTAAATTPTSPVRITRASRTPRTRITVRTTSLR